MRDSLANLPVASGGTCIGAALTADNVVDTDAPAAGHGYWYLLRARNALGIGSYGLRYLACITKRV